MTADQDLLRQYAETRAEAAFAELVRRHVDLVYAVALRKVGGDSYLAEDAAQQVFTALATKAAALARHPVLTGWLFTSTHYTASQLVRGERRRRVREQRAHAMNELLHDPTPPVDWERLRPLLDDLVLELEERDRDAVLLRFFEGRAFAEIGARLRLSEEGARARVDRAVDKLQALLAQRGITSTEAALGVALVNQASAAAPAGLAASVTTSALTTSAAAAAGGGLAAMLGFMGSIKITSGVIAIAAALALSATANGFLWWRTSSAPTVAMPSPAVRPAITAVPPLDLPNLATADLAAVRDRLRAAGVDASVARGVVEGALRRRYREKVAEVRAEQMRLRWWQDSAWYFRLGGQPVLGFVDDARLLREMVAEPLEKLFGPDPLEMAELDARFAFLPPEKRAAFVTLDRDYEAAIARLGGESRGPAAVPLNRERDDKRRTLLATLSTEERAEYELHFSDLAVALRERMDTIGTTEKEYRAIMAVVAPPGEGSVDRRGPGFSARDEQALQQLVPVLGYERAADYIWAGAREYASYARVAQEAGLAANTATRMLQLASETVERAIQIHANAALSGEQRKAAVIALQQEIRPQLHTLLPPPLQQKLAGEMMEWFNVLGQGRYRTIGTSALGSGGLMIGSVSVETPLPPGGGRKQFVVRRPGGN